MLGVFYTLFYLIMVVFTKKIGFTRVDTRKDEFRMLKHLSCNLRMIQNRAILWFYMGTPILHWFQTTLSQIFSEDPKYLVLS